MGKIVILGGGGHARVLIELIRVSGNYKIVGVLDPRLKKGVKVLDVPVLGGDELLNELFNSGVAMACIGVGSIRDNSIRRKLYEKVKQIGFSVPSLLHPKAVLSETSKIAEGVQVMVGTIVQVNNFIDENTIINTGAIVEHDCIIGKHVHICPGTIISGGCIIGDSAFIGAGATVIQGIKIGKNTIVAAGSLVVNNVPDGALAKGIPARV